MTFFVHDSNHCFLLLRYIDDDSASWFLSIEIEDLVVFAEIHESEPIQTKLSSINEPFIASPANIADFNDLLFLEVISYHNDIEVS